MLHNPGRSKSRCLSSVLVADELFQLLFAAAKGEDAIDFPVVFQVVDLVVGELGQFQLSLIEGDFPYSTNCEIFKQLVRKICLAIAT